MMQSVENKAEAIVEKTAITEDNLRQLLSQFGNNMRKSTLRFMLRIKCLGMNRGVGYPQLAAILGVLSNNHSISDKTALKYGRMLVATPLSHSKEKTPPASLSITISWRCLSLLRTQEYTTLKASSTFGRIVSHSASAFLLIVTKSLIPKILSIPSMLRRA
jgi:hypothetical protein